MPEKEKIFFGYFDLANCITLLGLILSLLSCFNALNGNIKISITLLIFSGVCDLFDGYAARKIKRTDLEAEFGIQLDTVADVASFGITPVIIVFSAAGASWHMFIIYALYVVCAVIRLAYFNTSAVLGIQNGNYRGLQVTYIALILPVAALFQSVYISAVTLAAAALLFVVNIKIPKPHGIWYILFPIAAVIILFLLWRL